MTAKKTSPASEALAAFCAKCCEDKKAEGIVMLKIAEGAAPADYFLICTVDSTPQLRAVADFVERSVRESMNLHPRRVAGEADSGWVILDFSDVIVHVMTAETRARYALERLWGAEE